MFLRLKKTDSGQVLKLLESYRDPDGVPRHRTIVSLGNPAISKHALGTIVKVNTATVSHENTSELGPVLVGLHAWNELGFDDILGSCEMAESRIDSARVAVINRLVEPVAENSLLDWYRSTALPDILQEKLAGAGDDRFYR